MLPPQTGASQSGVDTILKRVCEALCETHIAALRRHVEDPKPRTYRAADKASRMVNIVDEPELCNFIVPAVLKRGDFQVAVSSGGASPILARKIREVLGYRFGPEYAVVVDELARLRRELKDRVPREEKRRQFWEMLIDLDFFDSLEGPEIRARIKERAEQCLSQLAD